MAIIAYDFNLPVLEVYQGQFRMTPWALAVKEFRGIYDADKRSDKKVATATMLYIALREDYALMGVKTSDDDGHTYAMENCGILVLKRDWKANNHIYRAMEKYREIQLIWSVDMQLLFTAETAIQNLTKNLASIAREGENIFKKKDKNMEDIDRLDTLVGKLLEYTSKLSERIKTIEDLKLAIAKRRRSELTKRTTGNKQGGNFSNPENSIYNRKKKKVDIEEDSIEDDNIDDEEDSTLG